MDTYFGLYYPAIEVDPVLMKTLALFWDGIYRIVPKDFVPEDSREVIAFKATGFLRSIDPSEEASVIASGFINFLDNLEETPAALDHLELEHTARITRLHTGKVDEKIRERLTSSQLGKLQGPWLKVSEEFARYYMFFLSNEMANRRNLSPVTYDPACWTSLTYYHEQGNLQDYPYVESARHLVTLFLRDLIPVDITRVPVDQVLRFRERRRDERKRFMKIMQEFTKRLTGLRHIDAWNDCLQEFRMDIDQSLADLRAALKEVTISGLLGLTGIKALSFPIATEIIAKLAPNNDLWILSGLGIALGTIVAFRDSAKARKELLRQHDYSYLYFMSRDWKAPTRGGGDLNYELARNIEEFIND